jgi:tRNA (guanine37-N1)-methyltransferase
MQFDVLTLFPEMFNILNESIIGRAKEKGLINVNLINIRDFSKNKHKKVDDTPYGGGAGMVIQPDVVYDAYKSVISNIKDVMNVTNSKKIESTENVEKLTRTRVIYMSPQGKKLDQQKVEELSKQEHLILLCGHYEGIDQRVLDSIVDEEISIGDYVLTGGELPAMVLIDSVSRYVEGVLKDGSTIEESFSQGLLEYPQYTRPEVFEGQQVPEVLRSGNHQMIDKWRREQSLKRTLEKRPDLLEKVELSDEDKKILEKNRNDVPNQVGTAHKKRRR